MKSLEEYPMTKNNNSSEFINQSPTLKKQRFTYYLTSLEKKKLEHLAILLKISESQILCLFIHFFSLIFQNLNFEGTIKND